MASKNGVKVEPISSAIKRADSALEVEDQSSISTISNEVQCHNSERVITPNKRRGENKVQPINVIQRLDQDEDQIDIPSIESAEGGKRKVIEFESHIEYLQCERCFSFRT